MMNTCNYCPEIFQRKLNIIINLNILFFWRHFKLYFHREYNLIIHFAGTLEVFYNCCYMYSARQMSTFTVHLLIFLCHTCVMCVYILVWKTQLKMSDGHNLIQWKSLSFLFLFFIAYLNSSCANQHVG